MATYKLLPYKHELKKIRMATAIITKWEETSAITQAKEKKGKWRRLSRQIYSSNESKSIAEVLLITNT